VIRLRYLKAGKAHILTEFVASTGYHRKYDANKILICSTVNFLWICAMMSPFLSHHVPSVQFTFQVLNGSLFNWKWFTFEVLSVRFSSCADKNPQKY
ncbi:MAG: hypothetical protein U1B80_09145, partial [Anaerolineaceae bacterium]|nr:hypothetical protein [Anaerolineaceae bacterium]